MMHGLELICCTEPDLYIKILPYSCKVYSFRTQCIYYNAADTHLSFSNDTATSSYFQPWHHLCVSLRPLLALAEQLKTKNIVTQQGGRQIRTQDSKPSFPFGSTGGESKWDMSYWADISLYIWYG